MSIKKRIENLEKFRQAQSEATPIKIIRLRRGAPPIIFEESQEFSEDCNSDDVRTLHVVLRKD